MDARKLKPCTNYEDNTRDMCVFKRRKAENTNCLSSMRGVMIRCTESKKLVRLHNINVTF